MEFFCYQRDRPGSTPLRRQLVEQHWSYMDRFAATMTARGRTFSSDGDLTGSVHILDLADPAAARAFAFEEPGYQAGAYRDELLRRWRSSLGRATRHVSAGRADGSTVVGAAVLLQAPPAEAARDVLAADRYVGTEVHRWRPGGRPS
jgi:uncharacterized protein YciI